MPLTNFSIAVLIGDVNVNETNIRLPREDVETTSLQTAKANADQMKGTSHSNSPRSFKRGSYEEQDTQVDSRDPITCHRKRTSFSRIQQRMLEAKFQRAPYLTIQERNNLANFLELNSRQVKVWFQNRRNKWKRENRGQLLIQPSLQMKSYGAAFEKCFSCVMYNPCSQLYLKSNK